MDAHKFLIGISTDVRNCFLFRLTGIFTCGISPEKASINVISAPFPTLVRESRGANDPQCVPFVPQHYIEKLTSVDASIKNWTDAMSKELKAEPPNKEAAAKLITDSKLDFDDHAYLMDKITGSHGAKFVE